MNVVDLLIFLVVVWQGIWGYFRGVKAVVIGFLGVFLSLGVTIKFHAHVAAGITPVFSEYLSGHLKDKISPEVDPLVLEELGLSKEVISYWLLENEHKKVIGERFLNSAANGQMYEIEPLSFLLINVLSFLIFFWTLNYFTCILADMTVKRQKEVKASWLGLIIGTFQGFVISTLYLFLLILFTTLKTPSLIIQEIYNSKFVVFLLELFSNFWILFV